jgi:hypothetical protein
LGGESFTPARRAFDSPIAIACFVDRAPCFPSRTWCISSRTNSPAWVVGDFPWRSSSLARSIVCFSGMLSSSNRGVPIQPESQPKLCQQTTDEEVRALLDHAAWTTPKVA